MAGSDGGGSVVILIVGIQGQATLCQLYICLEGKRQKLTCRELPCSEWIYTTTLHSPYVCYKRAVPHTIYRKWVRQARVTKSRRTEKSVAHSNVQTLEGKTQR